MQIIYTVKYNCRNKGIVYLPPVLMLPRQRRVNRLVTHKRECHGIKEIEIASFATLTTNTINTTNSSHDT